MLKSLHSLRRPCYDKTRNEVTHCSLPVILLVLRAHFIEDKSHLFDAGSGQRVAWWWLEERMEFQADASKWTRLIQTRDFPLLNFAEKKTRTPTCHPPRLPEPDLIDDALGPEDGEGDEMYLLGFAAL